MMKLFESIKRGVVKIGVKKVKKESNILKEALDNPEKMILTAWIEDDEIVIKIKKKQEES